MKNKYIEYIIKNGLNLQQNQIVEIVGSRFLEKFINELKVACLSFGASTVSICYTDSLELLDKINRGYSFYIEKDVMYYKDLISKGFCRIVLHSPFLPSESISWKKQTEYKNCLKQLSFVSQYFMDRCSQKVICSVVNPYWASKVNKTEEELENDIERLVFGIYEAEDSMTFLNRKQIETLWFKNARGTDLKVGLTSNFEFQGKKAVTKKGIIFEPNIPCLEIYTAPKKEKVEGKIYSSRPFYYRGIEYKDLILEFKNGKLCQYKNVREILNLEDSLYYVGEIALAEHLENTIYYSTLLDENADCHLALGMAYPYGITELEDVNISNYHIDIVFGSKDMQVIGQKGEESFVIMDKGKFVYKK